MEQKLADDTVLENVTNEQLATQVMLAQFVLHVIDEELKKPYPDPRAESALKIYEKQYQIIKDEVERRGGMSKLLAGGLKVSVTAPQNGDSGPKDQIVKLQTLRLKPDLSTLGK